MNSIVDINKCTGCAACKAICGHDAILMEQDEKGFWYPMINQERCTNCYMCKRNCPANITHNNTSKFLDVYAYRNSNINELMQSTSGGAYTTLSDWIIDNGGVVCGAAFNKKFQVYHKIAKTVSGRNEFRGAKYVQSMIGNVYKEIENELKRDKYVLFTGTPCQVAGLKAYLKNDYQKLFTIDIVCHGVASPKVWKAYLRELELKYGEVKEFSFRFKPNGWRGTQIHIKTANGKDIYNTPFTRSYSDMFFKNYSLRNSCRDCKYKSIFRTGDVTLGDFWGYDDFDTTYKDEKGISLILVNSIKGVKLLKDAFKKDTLISADINKIPQANINRKSFIPKNENSAFWDDFNKKGYLYVAKKYTKYGLKNRIIENCKKNLHIWMRTLRKTGEH